VQLKVTSQLTSQLKVTLKLASQVTNQAMNLEIWAKWDSVPFCPLGCPILPTAWARWDKSAKKLKWAEDTKGR
jgi:hypothetical protein